MINSVLMVFAFFSCNIVIDDSKKFNDEKQYVSFSDEKDTVEIWDKIEDKVIFFKSNTFISRDVKNVPADFLKFYTGFLKDSINQTDNINFNTLIGVISECDTTIILSLKNWDYTTWNFTEHFLVKNDPDDIDGWNNVIHYSEEKFYYEFRLNEIGIIYQVGFEKINKIWKLSLYSINNC